MPVCVEVDVCDSVDLAVTVPDCELVWLAVTVGVIVFEEVNE